MFCDKCGASVKENETTCRICGKQLKVAETTEEAKEEIKQEEKKTDLFAMPTTTKDDIAKTEAVTAAKNKEKKEKFNAFLAKNKKKFIIAAIILIVAIGGFIAFNNLYDFTKISWNQDSPDINLSFTGPKKVSLSVDAYDKDKYKIMDIKFEVTGGEIVKVDGADVEWQLPSENGEFTITATAPRGKKITKSIKVYNLDEKSEPLFMNNEVEIKDEDDEDGDGLTNKQEKEYGTNLYSADTDLDGLIDILEINEFKTDPLKNDTDSDGILDGDEVALELDPLKADSKGDGVKDGERTLTYKKTNKNNNIEIEITGKGNIASTTVDILNNDTFANMDGVLNKVYNFYTSGNLESATVTIPYTVEELTAKGLTEDDLILYYFNEDTKALEKMETTVDKTKKVLVVKLNHFSKYVVGNKNLVLDDYSSDILFVIDNSVSMYTEKQMSDAGYTSSTGAVGNDKDFARIDLTKKMVDKFTGNYRFGVAEFAGDYKKSINFTKERDEVKSKADSLKAHWDVSLSGTNIVDALKQGTQEFSPTDTNGHYLILMTDGKNTFGNLSTSKDSILKLAKEHKVKICVIGLGTDLDIDVLSSIARETGCDYYSVSEASALEQVYDNVGSTINYNLVDTDGDGKTDGTIIADSGFIPKRDGFSFYNYRSVQTGGNCFGMAFFASLYYQKTIPLFVAPNTYSKYIFSKDETTGYDLGGTWFAKRDKNLYDYKVKDEFINAYLTRDYPDGFRDRVEDKTWKLAIKYNDEYTNRGFKLITKDNKTDDFDKMESVLIDTQSEKIKDYDKDAYELLRAIWHLYAMQNQLIYTNFSTEPDQAFNELVENLSKGIPQPLDIKGNTHEINAIKLIQDNKDSNKFIIEVYDNNFPGETRYMYMTRKPMVWSLITPESWSNEYDYEFSYDSNNDGIATSTDCRVSYVDFTK